MSVPPKKKLDTLVKLALGVLFGSFLLIWVGMFLSRPDRSIPPYSVGAQEGTAVAVHVPPWTSDSAIETLVERFRTTGRTTRDFGKMKIRPTTPGDPAGPYRRLVIYIFTLDAWAEPEMLHKYMAGDDPAIKAAFQNAVRGSYRLDGSEEEGRIGPILSGKDTAGTAAYARELFKGPITASDGSDRRAGTRAHSPLPPSGDRADRGP
ncbi:MAG TPA: hypothetical protein VGQ60_03310 [Nitrospiraceae bacterium]|jgi:hypothetical protein|nr:hypothetical protein [Nitrospiraceae bacterium]